MVTKRKVLDTDAQYSILLTLPFSIEVSNTLVLVSPITIVHGRKKRIIIGADDTSCNEMELNCKLGHNSQ